ncbi:MAG: MBL fold metallo-hydrolase [Pseudaminobacter sp.]
MSKALLTCISGFGAKGPACFLLEAEDRRLLLDFGRGPDHDALPDFDRIGRVDALVLSHGHRDHIGALPFLDQIGSPPVFATEWLRRDLPDIAFGGVLSPNGDTEILGLPVRTGGSGHAPGGVWLHFGFGDGFLYTGDYCPSSLLYRYHAPPPAATVLVDASYGSDDRNPAEGRQALLDIARQGPCLLPGPADGRGPEMAAFLHAAGIDVAMDDVHFRAVEHLCTEPEYVRSDMLAVLASLLEHARRVNAEASPAGATIVAGASGTAGTAGILLPLCRERPELRIVFTGHLAVGSPGEALVKAGRAESLRWNVHPSFSETRALLEAVYARRVVPAFAPREKLDALVSPLFQTVLQGDVIEIL